MKNFVNIDSVERLKRKKYSLKKTLLIAGLAAGIGGAAISLAGKGDSPKEPTAIEQQTSSKVFKSYEIKSGDTLTSIVEKIMEEYPETANYYTAEQLIKEVASINNLGTNIHNIQSGNYLVVPYYLPDIVLEEQEEFYDENKEAASNLEDYEDYVVQGGDSYWKIASKYTNDDNELVRLVQEIQELNDNQNLRYGSTIKIPNIEKYQLLHADYNEEAKTR